MKRNEDIKPLSDLDVHRLSANPHLQAPASSNNVHIYRTLFTKTLDDLKREIQIFYHKRNINRNLKRELQRIVRNEFV